jgi:hypothetical protein
MTVTISKNGSTEETIMKSKKEYIKKGRCM